MGRIRAHPHRDGLCLIQGERQQEKTKVALFEVYILPLQEKKTHRLVEIMLIETHACLIFFNVEGRIPPGCSNHATQSPK